MTSKSIKRPEASTFFPNGINTKHTDLAMAAPPGYAQFVPGMPSITKKASRRGARPPTHRRADVTAGVRAPVPAMYAVPQPD
jgi:hypothetical protein